MFKKEQRTMAIIEGIIDSFPLEKPFSNRDINKPYIKKIGELDVDPLDEVYLSIASYVTKVVDKINKDNGKKYAIKLIEVDTYYMKVKVLKDEAVKNKKDLEMIGEGEDVQLFYMQSLNKQAGEHQLFEQELKEITSRVRTAASTLGYIADQMKIMSGKISTVFDRLMRIESRLKEL